MEPVNVGIAGIILLIILFAIRVPVAFAMGIMGFLGFSYLAGLDAALNMVAVELLNVFFFLYPYVSSSYVCAYGMYCFQNRHDRTHL